MPAPDKPFVELHPESLEGWQLLEEISRGCGYQIFHPEGIRATQSVVT